MRIDGTLKQWNDDRGFGFITPTQGGQDVFVHISAFPHNGRRPTLGEALTFELTVAADGKKRAVQVERPGQSLLRDVAPRKPHLHKPRYARSPSPRHGWRSGAITVVLLAALGAYGYQHFTARRAAPPQAAVSDRASPLIETSAPATFRCDGRTHCSQMTSCKEATYFLKNCPGTKMDGNHDGVPCEQQWCR